MMSFFIIVLLLNGFMAYTGCSGVAEDVYIGEGILKQNPPSPYLGGVIQYPLPNASPDPRPFFIEEYRIQPFSGWVTTLFVEKAEYGFTDFIEVRNGERKWTIYSGEQMQLSESGDFTVEVRLFGMGTKQVRVRWISVPANKDIQGGFVARQDDEIVWSYPTSTSMLVNLVIDSGAIWNLDDGRSLIELQLGVQWINTSTLITGDKLTIVPHNQNLTTENTEFLIEWFPYTDDRHIISADNTSGCMQYSAEDLAEKQSFTWFLKQSNHSTLESSIHLRFIRVSSPTNFDLRIIIDGIDFMRSTTTVHRGTDYHIPVNLTTEVQLTLTPEKLRKFIMCYEPSNQTVFSASGYLRSENYPSLLRNTKLDSQVIGFPVPQNWSITFELENFEIEMYRSWLDLVLLSGESAYVIQSYTGNQEEFTKAPLDNGAVIRYDRYPSKFTVWQRHYQDILPITADDKLNENEIIARLQQTVGPTVRDTLGYSIRWTAQIQNEHEGKDIVYFSGNSGHIMSPNYPEPYHSGAKLVYDIQISDTENYNAIHLVFGESYTEPHYDLLYYNDRQEGRLVPLKLPTSLKSGNLTGKYITYQSTHILIYFVTNQQKEYMGFNMTWRALSLDLNDSTTASSSTVSSVSSSDGYTTVTSTMDSIGEQTTVIILSVIIVILFTLLTVAVVFIFRYRIKLSDVNKQGYKTPKYKPSFPNKYTLNNNTSSKPLSTIH